MLSGETAIGAHPLEAAEAAVRIATRCEAFGAAYLLPGCHVRRGPIQGRSPTPLSRSRPRTRCRGDRVLHEDRPHRADPVFSPAAGSGRRLLSGSRRRPAPGARQRCRSATSGSARRVGSAGSVARSAGEARLVGNGATVDPRQLDGNARLRPECPRHPTRRHVHGDAMTRRAIRSATDELPRGSRDGGRVDPGVGQLLLRGRRTRHVARPIGRRAPEHLRPLGLPGPLLPGRPRDGDPRLSRSGRSRERPRRSSRHRWA